MPCVPSRCFLLIAIAGLISCEQAASPRPTLEPDSGPAELPVLAQIVAADARPPGVAPRPAVDPDDEHRKQVVGNWKQLNTGVRWLNVRSDGTATMVVEPDWTAKLVIGDRLTMRIEWTIEEGRCLFRSVSGTPESAFKAVSTLFGRDRDRPITMLTDEKFVLLDEEDGSTSEWNRVGPSESVPTGLAE